ncbi:MAG TPA: PAS domain-containing protein [Arenibaculum sp.]|nr:PAS domain-containing protein [Arenibaculum sp.]
MIAAQQGTARRPSALTGAEAVLFPGSPDQEGPVVGAANDEFANLLGYPLEAVLGRPLRDLLADDQMP